MRRPLSHLPRLGRRPRETRADWFLSLPRLDPEWELAALHALMKPPRRAQLVRHKAPTQHVTPAQLRSLRDSLGYAGELLGLIVEVILPPEGDLLLIARLPGGPRDELIALAAVASRTVPSVTLKLGSLYVRAGQFLRRVRGIELTLGPARDIHVRRDLRAALSPLL